MLDYLGIHRDVCAMRNQAANYLADLVFDIKPRLVPSGTNVEALIAFERDSREFIERIWPTTKAAIVNA